MNSFVQLTEWISGKKEYVNMSKVQKVVSCDAGKGSSIWLEGCQVALDVQESPETIMELLDVTTARRNTEAALKWGSNSGTFELIRQVSRR